MFEQEVHWPAVARWLVYGAIVATVLPVVRAAGRPGGVALAVGTGIAAALLLAFVVIFSTLRIRVDADNLTLGFGPFRERVPRSFIRECTITTYRWQDWGGIGFRVRPEGRLYNVPGDGGVCVRLLLKNGQLLVFSSSDPRAVCRALEGEDGHPG